MISRSIQLEFQHRTLFTRDVFGVENPMLRDCLVESRENGPTPPKALVFLDEALVQANAGFVDSIRQYFEHHADSIRLAASPVVLPGGESCKNDWSLVESIWKAIHEAGLCRHSYVIAVGGGAILDLVGFAGATAHRGIRHVRLPTTTLSQGDGGVGVKNGVNYFGKKNWIGTFTVPHAIINDLNFLRTLPRRECRAGLIEAIKVGLIRDGEFFEALEDRASSLARLDEETLEFAIRRSAELHMNHIAKGGDPFELGSARPLDFGHWVAHKLEQLSEFRIQHGEAVAIGMAVDLIYAREKGLLSPEHVERILRLIQNIGFHLFADELLDEKDGVLTVIQGLEEFREHLGGELTITLVTSIGEAVEVHDIDESILPQVFAELQERFATEAAVAAPSRNGEC